MFLVAKADFGKLLRFSILLASRRFSRSEEKTKKRPPIPIFSIFFWLNGDWPHAVQPAAKPAAKITNDAPQLSQSARSDYAIRSITEAVHLAQARHGAIAANFSCNAGCIAVSATAAFRYPCSHGLFRPEGRFLNVFQFGGDLEIDDARLLWLIWGLDNPNNVSLGDLNVLAETKIGVEPYVIVPCLPEKTTDHEHLAGAFGKQILNQGIGRWADWSGLLGHLRLQLK
jgi:hypothetical protein